MSDLEKLFVFYNRFSNISWCKDHVWTSKTEACNSKGTSRKKKKKKTIWYEHSNNPKQHVIYVSQTQTGGMSFRLWGGIPLTLSQSCSALFLHCYTCDARLPYLSSTILYITCHQTPRSFFSLSRFQRSKLVMRNPEK